MPAGNALDTAFSIVATAMKEGRFDHPSNRSKACTYIAAYLETYEESGSDRRCTRKRIAGSSGKTLDPTEARTVPATALGHLPTSHRRQCLKEPHDTLLRRRFVRWNGLARASNRRTQVINGGPPKFWVDQSAGLRGRPQDECRPCPFAPPLR